MKTTISATLRSNALIIAIASVVLPAAVRSQPCRQNGVDLLEFSALLDNAFASIIGSAPTVPGTFAALDVDKEQKARLAASLWANNGNAVTFEANASSAGGIAGLFDAERDAAAIGFRMRLDHFGKIAMERQHDLHLEFTEESCLRYNKALTDESKDYEAARRTLNIRTIDLRWLSISAGATNRTFELFDSSRPFDKQLGRGNYATPEISVYRSHLIKSGTPWRSRLTELGLTASWEDNFDELYRVDLTTTQQFSGISGQRTATSRTIAYEGAWQTGMPTLTGSGDFYWLPFPDGDGAMHAALSARARSRQAPNYSSGIGVLWSVKRSDKVLATAELSYVLDDIAEARRSALNVWERNRLGVRIVFPFWRRMVY